VHGIEGAAVVLAGLLGLAVGVGSMLAFRLSERTQHTIPDHPAPELDEGLIRVLAVLRSAAVVLDVDDRVVRASIRARCGA
jgi:two-component system sensor histidine kinase SenX3